MMMAKMIMMMIPCHENGFNRNNRAVEMDVTRPGSTPYTIKLTSCNKYDNICIIISAGIEQKRIPHVHSNYDYDYVNDMMIMMIMLIPCNVVI